MRDAGPAKIPRDGHRMSVIVPAHNEAATVGRLLAALRPTTSRAEDTLDIVVVCNGCTDSTAQVARSYGDEVRVVESTTPGKAQALVIGNATAMYFPRAVVDADVLIDRDALLGLAAALGESRLACAPERHLELSHASLLVRWYYDVWQRLPQVREGLFGRGVVVLSREGAGRLAGLPHVMSDDLLASESFAPHERLVLPSSVVTIWPSRTVRDLVRRRIRVATGNAQLDGFGLRGVQSQTNPRSLRRLVGSEPRLVPRLPVFLGVAFAARVLARRAIAKGDYSTWLRDESSRQQE